MVAGQRLSLMQALSRYLAGLKDNEQRDGQQELNRFVHWCGSDRGTNQLTPYEVAEYGGSASMWGTDSARQMKPVKSFLTYLKQQGLVDASLAAHLKVPRMKRRDQAGLLQVISRAG